jgi:hypothetical protein
MKFLSTLAFYLLITINSSAQRNDYSLADKAYITQENRQFISKN